MRRSRRPVWTKTYTSVDDLPAVCLVGEVACVLRMSENWVRNKLSDGTIHGFKVGDKWCVPKENLLQYMGICSQQESPGEIQNKGSEAK